MDSGSIVYEPREDSYLLEKYVEKICKKGFHVLDMGTGSGIQGIAASKKADKVISCDINPDAVKHAKESASISKIRNIEFIESDLFSNIKKQGFDLIIFNPPYLPKEKDIENTALFSAKRGTETTTRFIDSAGEYLKEDGVILLIGSSLASWKAIEEAIDRNLLEYEILERMHVFFEDIFVFSLKKSAFLKKLGLTGVKSPKLYAKGKRGIIIRGIYNSKQVAVKTKKKESSALGTIVNEARFLEKLNRDGIGPKLIMHNNEFLMYEFAEGEMIFDFVKKSGKKDIILVLKEIFSQMQKMDSLGINKFEMHHPIKHIIVCKGKSGLTSVLIDFERARHTDDPKNVTQFCDFLIGEDMGNILGKKGINIEKEKIIAIAKGYKKKRDIVYYEKILAQLK